MKKVAVSQKTNKRRCKPKVGQSRSIKNGGRLGVAVGSSMSPTSAMGHILLLAFSPAAAAVGAAECLNDFCPPGQYTNYPASPCACEPCSPGTANAWGAVWNEGGMFTVCEECVPGRHAPDPGSFSCAECPDNTYAPSAGWGEECLTCEPGRVPNDARSSCEECGPGRYGDGGPTCPPCPPGTYNPSRGGTPGSCQTCPSASSNAARTACACDPDPSAAGHVCPQGWQCPTRPNAPGPPAEASAGLVPCERSAARPALRRDPHAALS
jgi:hypothetical protein